MLQCHTTPGRFLVLPDVEPGITEKIERQTLMATRKQSITCSLVSKALCYRRGPGSKSQTSPQFLVQPLNDTLTHIRSNITHKPRM